MKLSSRQYNLYMKNPSFDTKNYRTISKNLLSSNGSIIIYWIAISLNLLILSFLSNKWFVTEIATHPLDYIFLKIKLAYSHGLLQSTWLSPPYTPLIRKHYAVFNKSEGFSNGAQEKSGAVLKLPHFCVDKSNHAASSAHPIRTMLDGESR